jgi:hypothetical protein
MFQDTSSTSNKNDKAKPNELLGHKSEMSYYVPPTTHVSKEPFSSSSKTENISDADDDLLHSSIQTESTSKSVSEKQQDETTDYSSKIEDDEQSIQVIFFFNKCN